MDMIGLYPMWYEPGIGSGWIIGVIATLHVLFSHTSVGAAILFAVLAYIGYRDNRPELIEFIKKYGLFLLVFSYVLGSITGPGIWYSTTVGSPRGISALIHTFVWKWATEWVFFVIEVIGIYMLVYLVGKVSVKTHMKIAVIFGIASYGTMVIIIGILSFMMWPGQEKWITDGGYLNAFYGEHTFAALAVRTAFMFTMAAVVGGIIAAGLKDKVFKRWLVTRLSIVGIGSVIVGSLLFVWYMNTLPESAYLVYENRVPESFIPMVLTVLALIMAYFIVTLIQPKFVTATVASIATVAILVLGLWPGETIRESIRKPWVAGQYVYGNQIIGRDVPGMNVKSEIPAIEEHGFTKTAVFWPESQREINYKNAHEVGRTLAITTCTNCHSLSETGIRPMVNYLGGIGDYERIKTYLLGALATGNTLYMPRIPLKDDEAEALALYLASLNDPGVVARYQAAKSAVAQNTVEE